jgi:ribose transport system ATP-binding protein
LDEEHGLSKSGASAPRPTLRVRLTKQFGAQRALDDVRFSVSAGEIHALVGQNGSGKSTVVKILAAYHRPEAGSEIEIDGTVLETWSASDVERHGVRFLHQDLGLIGSLDTVSNLLLGTNLGESPWKRIRWRRERERARRHLHEFGVTVDLDSQVSTLPRVTQTVIAIVRALRYSSTPLRLLVLDEPTAALTRTEARFLFTTIRQLARAGGAVLYISHHLSEVFDLADTVTVLRDGHLVKTTAVRDITREDLVRLLLGRSLSFGRKRSDQRFEFRDPALIVRNVSAPGVGPVDLQLHRGEILGLAGVAGCGGAELLEALAGIRPRTSGSITVTQPISNGSDAQRSVMHRGIAYLPADRLRKSAVPIFTVQENLTLPSIPQRSLGRIDHSRDESEALKWIRRVGVQPEIPQGKLESLSGGNQQKVFIARWLRLQLSVMLLDNPTQGVDIGARARIVELLRDVAAGGCALLVFSSEPDELELLCDRSLVLNNGRIVAELHGSELTAQRILLATMSEGSDGGTSTTPA